ncbi:MAG: FmdB family zinc ribbon protein [Phycisphaerales bacterium]
MPTYDYKCKACDHRFEHFQSMSDKTLKKCPECGKNALERLIGTGAALIFKGSGFYQTDYRSESYKKSAESDKPADTKPAEPKAGEAKPAEPKAADPTPAPKAEPKPAPVVEPKSASKPRKSAKKR